MSLPKIGEEVVVCGSWGEQVRLVSKVELSYYSFGGGLAEIDNGASYFLVDGFPFKWRLTEENPPIGGFGWRRGGLDRERPEDPPIAKQVTSSNPPTMVPVAELDALRSKLLLGTAKIVGDYDKKIAELNQTIEGLENSRNGWQRDAENSHKRIEELKEENLNLKSELSVYDTKALAKIYQEVEELKNSRNGWQREAYCNDTNAKYWRKKYNELLIKALQDKLKEKGSVECCCPEVGDEVYFFSVDNEGNPILKGQWTKKKTEVEKVCEDGFWGYGRDKRFFRDVGKTWKW
jgi:FtsZ-binding cell division protein ZapB